MRSRFIQLRLGSAALCASLAIGLLGCDSNATGATNGNPQGGDSQCETGAERCSCYKNDTCDSGLTCLSGLCVSTGPGTTPTTNNTIGSGGSLGTPIATGASVGTGGAAAGLGGSAASGATVVGTGGTQSVNSSPTPELADGTVGSSCGTCATGLMCVTDAPGGYCTKSCASNAECSTAGTCIQLNTTAACFRVCKTNADCRPNYDCVNAGVISVCDIAATTDPGTTAVGSCANSCAHYLDCKGLYDSASYQNCVAACGTSGYTPAYLATYQATDCATAIQLVEGSSGGSGTGTGTGSSSSCSGCAWDGSSCVYLSQYTLVSTAGISCDSACCK